MNPDRPRTWSPYLWFVWCLAQLIDGEYPAHYDSWVRRRVRLVFALALALETTILLIDAPIQSHGSRLSQVQFVLSMVIGMIMWHGAQLRRQSLEKHVLKTNHQRILREDSDETAADVVTLYDYMKVFFVLELLAHVPMLAASAVGGVVLEWISMLAIPFMIYYLFLFVEILVVVGGRWARQYITNDRSPSTSDSTSPADQ